MGPYAKTMSLKEIAEQREASHLLATFIEHSHVIGMADGKTTFTVTIPDELMHRLSEWDASTADLEEDADPDEGDITVIGEPVANYRLRRLLYFYLSMKRQGEDMSSDEVKELMNWQF